MGNGIPPILAGFKCDNLLIEFREIKGIFFGKDMLIDDLQIGNGPQVLAGTCSRR